MCVCVCVCVLHSRKMQRLNCNYTFNYNSSHGNATMLQLRRRQHNTKSITWISTRMFEFSSRNCLVDNPCYASSMCFGNEARIFSLCLRCASMHGSALGDLAEEKGESMASTGGGGCFDYVYSGLDARHRTVRSVCMGNGNAVCRARVHRVWYGHMSRVPPIATVLYDT